MKSFSLRLDSPTNSIALNVERSQVIVAGRNILKVYQILSNQFAEILNFRQGKSLNLSYSSLDVAWNFNDANQIATASRNGDVVLWDYGKCRQLCTFSEHSRICNRIIYHSDNQLVSGSQDGTLRIYDSRRRTCALTLHTGADSVRDVASSVAPQRGGGAVALLAVACESGLVQLWDTRRPDRALGCLAAHSGPAYTCAWHPCSAGLLASGGRDRTVKVWSVDQMCDTLVSLSHSSVQPPATSAASKLQHTALLHQYCVSTPLGGAGDQDFGARHSATCHLYHAQTLGTTASVGHITWSPNTREYCLASASLLVDCSVYVWGLRRTYVPSAYLTMHTEAVTRLLWRPDDEHVLMSLSRDGLLCVHHMEPIAAATALCERRKREAITQPSADATRVCPSADCVPPSQGGLSTDIISSSSSGGGGTHTSYSSTVCIRDSSLRVSCGDQLALAVPAVTSRSQEVASEQQAAPADSSGACEYLSTCYTLSLPAALTYHTVQFARRYIFLPRMFSKLPRSPTALGATVAADSRTLGGALCEHNAAVCRELLPHIHVCRVWRCLRAWFYTNSHSRVASSSTALPAAPYVPNRTQCVPPPTRPYITAGVDIVHNCANFALTASATRNVTSACQRQSGAPHTTPSDWVLSPTHELFTADNENEMIQFVSSSSDYLSSTPPRAVIWSNKIPLEAFYVQDTLGEFDFSAATDHHAIDNHTTSCPDTALTTRLPPTLPPPSPCPEHLLGTLLDPCALDYLSHSVCDILEQLVDCGLVQHAATICLFLLATEQAIVAKEEAVVAESARHLCPYSSSSSTICSAADNQQQLENQPTQRRHASISMATGTPLAVTIVTLPANAEVWIHCYLDLLWRLRQWTTATCVIGLLPSYKSVNTLNRGALYRVTCPACTTSPASGMKCPACNCAVLCAYCEQPVLGGLYTWCQVCGHGGHLLHMRQWFSTHALCPAGCHHRCY